MICDAFFILFSYVWGVLFPPRAPANNQKCAPDSDKRDVFLQYDC